MRKLIGHVAVDSGQLIISDPCYLRSWKDGEATDLNSHYGQACIASLSDECAGEILVSGIAGTGVVFSTGGDGAFPVYAHYQKDGSISKIEISALY
jgi:hypothetical protein